MKFALINEHRHEAQPGLAGHCPSCGQAMIARCGAIKIWHWAHKGRRNCDPWWESETEWHRNWKGNFPKSWQEVVHHDSSGEKHIADVKTHQGWVIEFQHSHIKPEERRSRDVFYPKLVWVVDGLRRKTDPERFRKVLGTGIQVGPHQNLRKVWSGDCTLLREWSASSRPVFFDFGAGPAIWWLIAGNSNGWSYVAPYSRADFIALHCGRAPGIARDFDAFVTDARSLIAKYESNLQTRRY